jgi:hypothetical protein
MEVKTLICFADASDVPMLPRDLDALIAEKYFGWVWTDVGKDYEGKNDCKVLTEDGEIPPNTRRSLIGKLHPAYLVPRYSRSLIQAFIFASKMGFGRVTINTFELECQVPEIIVRSVIREIEKER